VAQTTGNSRENTGLGLRHDEYSREQVANRRSHCTDPGMRSGNLSLLASPIRA